MSPSKQLALLSNDLMFSSSIEGVARLKGASLQVVASPDALLATCEENELALVVIDLTTPQIDLADLVSQLRQAASPPRAIIAYGPHVHEEKLAVAHAAGCDEVLTRGQMHARLPEVIGRYVES